MKATILFLISTALFLYPEASAQEFDEKFEHWPIDLRIGGTVIVHHELEQTRILEEAVVRFIANDQKPQKDKKIPAVVIAGSSTATVEKLFKDTLSNLDKKSPVFSVDNFKPEELKSAVNQSFLVVLDWDKETRIQPSKLDQLVKVLNAFIANKGILVANSNSAKWLSATVVQSGKDFPVTTQGLDVVPDSVIETNFSTLEDEQRVRSVLAYHPRLVGIGIKKNTCLVLRGRKFYTYETGEAKFMLAGNERQPQRNHMIGAKYKPKSRYDFEYNRVDLTEWRRDAIDRTLAPFPPAKPREPKVDNGTLVIVGGGGMPQNLMKELVEMAGGKKANMVYVPCSESDTVSNRQRTVEYWKQLGVNSATVLHTKDRIKANSDTEFLKPLQNATGIWFGGGRQWNFADSYYGTKAHKLMKEVLKRGGVIGGSSAGASIQARYLARATPIANYKIMAPGYERGGLGFISGVAIDQHFSQRGRQKDMTQLVNRYPQLLGIGIDEATAIIVTKSTAKVVGRGKVHFYDRKRPVYPDRPDYIALAKGSAYDLKLRKVIFDASENAKKIDANTEQSSSSVKPANQTITDK